jgi:hypothetical protein
MTNKAGSADASFCKSCDAPKDERGKGYVYAIATAILCPCHMALWGVALGGTAAGVLFEQYFWSVAIGLGALSLLTFAGAARILLLPGKPGS